MQPIVDSSVLFAVGSMFANETPTDPWAAPLAGALADLVIYSERFGWVQLAPRQDEVEGLSILWDAAPYLAFKFHSCSGPIPVIFETDEDGAILPITGPAPDEDAYYLALLEKIGAWINSNRETYVGWLKSALSPRAQKGEQLRSQHVYRAAYSRILDLEASRRLCSDLSIARDGILYLIWGLVHYASSGALAGEEDYYLSHPIHRTISLPGQTEGWAPGPRMAIRFGPAVEAMAPRLSHHEYVELVLALRSSVRNRGIQNLDGGQVERSRVREIAREVGLAPRLRATARVLGVVGGIVGALTTFSATGPIGGVAGGLISIASAVWGGALPRAVARAKWLDWALSWDVESQSNPLGRCR